MKRIEIVEHALERVYQRNVGDAQIRECIENPDWLEPGKKDRVRAEKVFGNKRLRVVFKELQHSYIVITVMWV